MNVNFKVQLSENSYLKETENTEKRIENKAENGQRLYPKTENASIPRDDNLYIIAEITSISRDDNLSVIAYQKSHLVRDVILVKHSTVQPVTARRNDAAVLL